MRRNTIIVGIPAYNEEQNIAKLIESLIEQNHEHFSLKKIIVISDCSTDKTDKIVRSYKNEDVILIRNKRRLGKALGQNILFKKFHSDVLIILDADVAIKDKNFLEKMANPVTNGVADLVSCRVVPLQPKSLVGRILYQNFKYKMIILEKWKDGNNMYLCCGRARSFSKGLIKSLKFPKTMGEDVYSYLRCIEKEFKFLYQTQTEIFFQLPETLIDHKRQNSRFWHLNVEMSHYFDKEFVRENFGMPLIALEVSVLFFLRNPIYYFLYLFLSLRLKFFSSKEFISPVWQSVETSKKLNIK
jgi:glycosyltransferase involved in cell wall biosynthesis